MHQDTDLHCACIRRDGVLLITVMGHLNSGSAPLFDEHCDGWLEEDDEHIVLDCGALDFISSAGGRSILLLAKRVRAAHGTIGICALQESVAEVFAVGGFDKIVPVFESVEQAIAATGILDSPATEPAKDDAPAGAEATGFLFGEIYLKHDTGYGHPERPERLTAIVRRLKETGLFDQLAALQPVATDRKWLATVHTPQYIDRVKASCQRGLGFVDSPDSPACEESYDVALQAVGGVLAAVDAVMEGQIANAFCAVRPPGHHALRDHAMGFCLFNNVAIAARYLQQEHKLAKILIADWDVHHGNGTHDIFYDDPTVLYFSTHRFPFYPMTGDAKQRGTGKGTGYTINIPLSAGVGDREHLTAFRDVLKPAAEKFEPDFVLVSAGFDSHQLDPLGGMNVTTDGFGKLTRIVKAIADEHCGGRLVSLLEGGYGLEGLAESVEAHIRVLRE